jgi:MFS family permease
LTRHRAVTAPSPGRRAIGVSFATYCVGYVARPIGAFFMGHIGDRYGRKRVLVLTLTLMGTGTFLVGCL